MNIFAFVSQVYNLVRPHIEACIARYGETCCAAREARRRLALHKRLHLEILEDRINPIPYLWMHAVSDLYTNGSNWTNMYNGTTGVVPGVDDTGTIPAGSTCILDSATTVGGLFVPGGGFTLEGGGVLEITELGGQFNGGNAFCGQLQVDAGDHVTLSGSGNIFANGAHLAGAGMFNVIGALNIDGAVTISGNMTLNPNGATGGTLVDVTQRGTAEVTDQGEFYWDSGTIDVNMTLEPTAAFQTQTAGGKTPAANKNITNESLATDLGGTGTLTLSSRATFEDASGEVRLTI